MDVLALHPVEFQGLPSAHEGPLPCTVLCVLHICIILKKPSSISQAN